jgi:CRP-like cAMP-binding protein
MRAECNSDPPISHGPSIAAVGLWGASGGRKAQLLSDAERARLSAIASIVRFGKGAQIYREGDRADAVFNIINGVVKSYRVLPDKTERIAAFLFADDLFGLAEEGHYTNATKALTAVTAHRIPASALESRLRRDAALEFHVICKLCHELREAQRHALLLSALARMAMFLQLLEHHQSVGGESARDLYLPMNRSDIGDYLGMSLEAVSRSFRALVSRGILRLRNKRYVRVLNRAQLDVLADSSDTQERGDGTARP